MCAITEQHRAAKCCVGGRSSRIQFARSHELKERLAACSNVGTILDHHVMSHVTHTMLPIKDRSRDFGDPYAFDVLLRTMIYRRPSWIVVHLRFTIDHTNFHRIGCRVVSARATSWILD